jgi:hypothetical protein
MATIEDVIARLDGMSTTLNEVKDQGLLCNQNFESLVPRINVLESDLCAVKKDVAALKEKNIQLESYIRRDNLIFGGLTESSPEDCEAKVRFLIEKTLKIPCDQVKFVRVHRLGRSQKGKPRPIIARFHYFGDRQNVWKARGNLNSRGNYRDSVTLNSYPALVTMSFNTRCLH